MSLLTHRRALLSAKGKVLPYAYQQVEYLESTGTQYIDTGIVPNNETGFCLIAAFPEIVNDIYRFGCKGSGSENRFIVATQGSAIYFGFNGIIPNSGKWSIHPNHFYKLELNFFNSRYADVDNRSPHFLNYSWGGIPYSALMFGRNSNGNISASAQKIKECKMTQGEKLVRDFIPCYRKADNEAGLYDLVNGKFYTNKGTGEFILGGEV